MKRYLFHRLLALLPVLLVVAVVVFFLIHLAPGAWRSGAGHSGK